MPNLCRDTQIKTLPKIADVLTQLLQVTPTILASPATRVSLATLASPDSPASPANPPPSPRTVPRSK